MGSCTLPIGAVLPTVATAVAATPAFIFPEIRNPILDKTGLRRNCPAPLFFILFQSIPHITIAATLYLSPAAFENVIPEQATIALPQFPKYTYTGILTGIFDTRHLTRIVHLIMKREITPFFSAGLENPILKSRENRVLAKQSNFLCVQSLNFP